MLVAPVGDHRHRQPGTAALFSIFLLSLIGVPLTAGFFGKFYIFKAALDANLVWLTVIGLLTSGRLCVTEASRCAHERGGGILLPAPAGGDVHEGAR